MKINFSRILAVALFLAAGGTISTAGADETVSRGRTISVSGEGKATAPPDQVALEFEVTGEGPDLDAVSSDVRARMNKVFGTVKGFGVSDKEFRTVNYSIQPKYKYDKEGNESKQVGFTVSNRIRVTLKKVESAGKVLTAVTKAGISRIDGPTFGFSDPTQLQLQAMKSAVENARTKAEALAQSAGVELGRVYSITQSGVSQPVIRHMSNAMSFNKAEGDVPIAQGEDEVTAQVEVVYSIK